MVGDRVRIDSKAVLGALRRGQGEEAWIRIVLDPGELRSVDVGHAIAQANKGSLDDGADTLGAVAAELNGEYAVLVQRPGTKSAYMGWLESIASALEAEGVDAAITAAPQALTPAWFRNDSSIPPQPSALIAYRTIDLSTLPQEEGRFCWALTPDATARVVASAVRWSHLEGAEVQLGLGEYAVVAQGQDVQPMLTAGLERDPRGTVRQFTAKPPTMRAAVFGQHGSMGLQVLDRTASWRERVDDLIEGMCWHPDLMDAACIAHMGKGGGDWSQLGSSTPRPPYVMEYQFRYKPDLRRQFVPDAHGAQVLTQEHLDKAHDLTSWHVADIGHGRSLVRAPDLEPWYAGDAPEDGVVAEARADFGDMILTDEVAETYTTPWG